MGGLTNRVSVVIPTRGNVDLSPILDSEWPECCVEIVVWDNSKRPVDVGPHGRFAAIAECSSDVILCQDDDVLLPLESKRTLLSRYQEDAVVANVPAEFRPHYPDSCLLGFGACFHRDAPERAFARFFAHHTGMTRNDPVFLRESCRLFTTLTPRVLVDVAREDLPYASDPDRLWMQQDHVEMRERMLRLAREVRDA